MTIAIKTTAVAMANWIALSGPSQNHAKASSATTASTLTVVFSLDTWHLVPVPTLAVGHRSQGGGQSDREWLLDIDQRRSQKGNDATSTPSRISMTATKGDASTSPVPNRLVTRVSSARVRRRARMPTASSTRHGTQ
jgi:hypothetical protein